MRKIATYIIMMTILLILAGEKIHAKKIAVSTDYYKDPFVLMDDRQIYVVDRVLSKAFIYDRSNFKKITEFGSRGEGPGEFIGLSKVYLLGDYIYIVSYPKLNIFTKKGKLHKVINGPPEASAFIPVGKNFIGESHPYSNPYDKQTSVQFSLFDPGFKKQKDLYLAKFHAFVWAGNQKENILWIRDCIKTIPFQEKAIIGDTAKGFYFKVFDSAGTMLFEINKEYKKRKVTEDEKNLKLNESKNKWGEKRWNDYKLRYNTVFPEYYPAFNNFAVDNNKVYVFLFPGEKSIEVHTINIKGELLRTTEIPLLEAGVIDHGRFAICNGKLYYLADNLETKTWEFHEIGID